ncbi:MAG: LptF/LptG family permease [Candidatus Bipolaricaulota bacterium]|nr:LptF/LptG family permease [Candidatus Bipolaricaulota bacterium]MDW8126216.1 LptF/LptG family permease [Candidatus Bipolaricaulota bacterium]
MRLRLDSYLVREILPPFFVALLAFLVFIGLELILSLSDVLFSRGISTAVLLRLLSYKLPNILTLAAPAGVLLATFLALARLASDRELLAFQALGYSLRRLLLPFLAFGLVISGLSFVFSELVVPTAEARYRQELLSLLYRGPSPVIQENVFFRGAQGELFYVERYTGNKVEGVVIYDLSGQLYPRSSFPAVITAKTGQFSAGRITLTEGRVMHFGASGELTEILGFQELTIAVGEGVEEAILGGRTPSEMSTRELRARIEILRQSGHDVRSLLVEYHGKLAVAAAAFVFVLFGAPLGAILGHRGRATGMVVGFLLATGAQALFLWARTLARRGFLPPALGGWLPHLVFGAIGVLLFLGADRLRFRGLLLFILLGVAGFAAPPFTELSAEELVIEAEGTVFLATNARLVLSEYTLVAARLSLSEQEGWVLEAQEAEVRSAESSVHAKYLAAELTKDGVLTSAELQNFSGAVKFSGPEKEETLWFSAEQGEVEFQAGELVRVAGTAVVFTTCPCIEGAPYRVQAEEFLLLPEKWLFARNLQVHSFGYPVVWLPFYAARLGEAGVPFLPEVGHSALGWFLRWSIPWSLAEGTVGAFTLTLYPQAGRIDPAMHAFWDNGELALSKERANLRMRGIWLGQDWDVQGRYDSTGLFFSLSGRLRDWQLSVQAGVVETGEKTYTRLPEIIFSRSLSVLGGNLILRLGVGRYREGETEGWRAGFSGSWDWSAPLETFRPQLSLRFSVDQYPGAEQAYFGVTPKLSLGWLALWYEGQISAGRSLFTFDAAPRQSQFGFSIQAMESGRSQSLVVGWDFLENAFLPIRWTVKSSDLSFALSFQLPAISLLSGKWEAKVQTQDGVAVVSGGFSGTTWEDVVVRGSASRGEWMVEGGLRLAIPCACPKRVALAVQGALNPEWSAFLWLEYDFLSQEFVQLGGSVFYTFLGCLRLGLSLYLGGFSVSLEIPAFPEAKVRFAPLDEGLRVGGL